MNQRLLSNNHSFKKIQKKNVKPKRQFGKKIQKISNEFQGQYFGHQDLFISNKIVKIQT